MNVLAFTNSSRVETKKPTPVYLSNDCQEVSLHGFQDLDQRAVLLIQSIVYSYSVSSFLLLVHLPSSRPIPA